MIAKIMRGAKIGGLMVYLLGESEDNKHVDRHIIAGSPTVMRAQWLEHFDGPADKEAARETALAVAHEIDMPRKLHGTEVRMKAKPVAVSVGAVGRELGLDVVEPARKGEKSEMRDAPVWHCVLSLMPGEHLDDAKWAQVTNEFMRRMGFVGTKDGYVAHARWAAVRHGLSGEHGDGQDHVHIAASLVREDGRKVSTYDYGPGRAKGDWRRADEVCGELEREFGLQILATRHEGGGLSGNSRAEYERAKRTNAPETERERLRRAVRAVAGAADSEADFVAGLRGAGIAIRPRYATGGTTEVTGYSVRWRRDGAEVGPWVGGGKLAKDLTLTALREQQWDDTPEAREAALAAWKNQAGRSNRTGIPGGEGVGAWQQAAAQTEQWRQRLGEIPVGDHRQWAWMAGQAAGVFAAWSETLEGDKPGPFASAAQELTRSAQVSYSSQRWRPPSRREQPSMNWCGDLARLILSESARAARPRSHRSTDVEDVAAVVAVAVLAAMLLLLLAAIAIAVAVAQAHRARGEFGRALAVEHMTRQHLDPVRGNWNSELEERREQWDRDAAQVFTAAAGRAAQRAIDEAIDTTFAAEPDPAEGGDPWEEPAPSTAATVAPDESVLPAANAPLTPPKTTHTSEQQPRPPQRVLYTDLSREERSILRVRTAAGAAFAGNDITPRTWPQDMLAAELDHARTEVQLLVEELAARRADGPHTRQAHIDNAAVTKAAAKIPDAQDAAKAVKDLEREHARLVDTKTMLAQQLDATPGRKMLVRSKLSKQIGENDTKLAELREQLPGVRAAAAAAAQATGVPATEWNEVLFESGTMRQRARLTEARHQDARDLREDEFQLSHLQRDLSKIEAEHARREKLTPAQRENEAATHTYARSSRRASPKITPSTSRDTQMPYLPPPDLGHGRDDGLGL